MLHTVPGQPSFAVPDQEPFPMRKLILTLVFVFLPAMLLAANRDDIALELVRQWEARLDPVYGFPWGTHTAPKGYHSNFETGTRVRPTRSAMEYAACLLASPKKEHQERGNAVLVRLIDLQDQDPESRTFGIWAWYAEEPLSEMAFPDYNWADFIGAILVVVLRDYSDRLSDELREKTRQSLEFACRAIVERNVGPGYTNIAIKGATVTAAAGEVLNRPDFLEYGRKRIQRSHDHFLTTGGFTEYNSPTYAWVVIRELERMLYLVTDSECRVSAKALLDATMKMVAEHYHVPTAQWAGPHSRAYGDHLRENHRKGLLTRAGLLAGDAEVERDSFFVPWVACSEALQRYFKGTPHEPVERRNVFAKGRPVFEVDGTTWMDAVATIGSASYHSFWDQARGLIGYWTVPDAAPAVLRLRFFHDEQDFASAWGRHRQVGPRVLSTFGLLKNWGSMHPSFDRPKDGVFTAKSFRIVYQLAAKGAAVRQLDANRFELAAGPVRAVVHVTATGDFDGQPVVWRTEQIDGRASVIGVCYEGGPKEFATLKMGDIRMTAAVELLQGDTKPSDAPIQTVESNFVSPNDGPFYGVIWQGLGDEIPLLAPCRPTNR